MATFLITGANRGIGLELVRQAAADGHHVLAACRGPGRAKELKALEARDDCDVEVVPMDVAEANSIGTAKTHIGTKPIHVLINNAGIMGDDPQSPLDMNFDVLTKVLAVNTVAPLRVTKAFLPNLEATKGKVIVISSGMGSFGYEETSKMAYCTSKTAVNRLFHGLASALRPKGVAVGIYSPGWVRTAMGGPGATLSVEESARGLLQQIEKLDLARSGSFSNYAGRQLNW
ncbi:MAG: hypothetical protein BGP04_14895 [Rhizobiales bacterium 62-17]|nr:SDR family oxidoreductase [Hyphomicrobiales bacterium]OJY03074.1 MAG: hypothetical protein BGP04_14895 [Rhizobiales bacterium 62-17]